MCIAIYKPAGAWASKRFLHNSFDGNPDGAGFAWHDGERVQVRKGFFTWKAFWASYKKHVTADVKAFAHFRITTRGSSDKANCHPYNLGNGVLMHNGPCLNVKHCNGDKKGDRSDSRQFAEDFIRGMKSWQVKRIAPMIEAFIGTEKVVMMFDDGEVVMCNEDEGMWANGCWWSNASFQGPGMRSAYSSRYIYDPLDDYYHAFHTPIAAPKSAEESSLTFGSGRPVLTWSTFLKQYIPSCITLEGVAHRWRETLKAYVPVGTANDAMADGDYVYEENDDGWEVVAETIRTELELKDVLEMCEEADLIAEMENQNSSNKDDRTADAVVSTIQ